MCARSRESHMASLASLPESSYTTWTLWRGWVIAAGLVRNRSNTICASG